MSDFAKRYNKGKGGGNAKQQSKDNKKAVTKALHDAFKLAVSGQIAGINHEKHQYFMLRKDIFDGIVQSGGKVLLSEEQKEFHKHYQVLLQMMNSLNIEVEEESELFDEIDQFTFDFSQAMNDPNGAKKRREILQEFEDAINENELLATLYTNLRKQIFPEEVEEVENSGKLT